MAATLYGSDVADGAWNTLGNWFTDGFNGSDPSPTIPQANDTVFTDGTLTTGPTVAVVLSSFDNSANTGSDLIDTYAKVSVTVGLNISNTSWVTAIPSTCTATISASLSAGAVNGSLTLLNSSNSSSAINAGGSVSCGSDDENSQNSGPLQGGVASFTGGTAFNSGNMTAGKIIFDFSTFQFNVANGGNVFGGGVIVSYDDGDTFLIPTGLMPAANKVATSAATYNSSGNSVPGTMPKSTSRGLHSWLP